MNPCAFAVISARALPPLLAAGLLVTAGGEGPAGGTSWPQFRGDGTGIATTDRAPRHWSREDNVAWVTTVPGRGWSSPIVQGDRVFLTSAISGGIFKEPTPGIYGNDYMAELIEQGVPPQEAMTRVRLRDTEATEEVEDEVRWMVYAFSATTGEMLWEREAWRGKPFGGRHRKNTYASETPVTDGERVFAYFGNVGLFAYDVDGQPLWERRFEPQAIYLDFGTASSPIIHEGRVLVLNDTQSVSFLAAFDARTGDEAWRVQRHNDNPLIRSGFSTPFVWRHAGRSEIVAAGPQRLVAYDTEGEELWRYHGTSLVAAPTPVADSERLFFSSGSPSEDVRPIIGIAAGAEGNITPTGGEAADPHLAWVLDRGGAYITSPILVDGRLYVLDDRGFFAAYDSSDGRRIYRARIGQGGNTFSASPWFAAGRLYCLSEEGTTFVLAPGDAFEILAENPLEEMSLATPAVAHGSFFIRTATRLFRIGTGD